MRAFLGAATLAAGGGIAHVARISARALGEMGVDVEIASYLDAPSPMAVAGSRVTGAGGSKLRFAALCQMAAFRRQYFIYDSGGMARAHPSLVRPGMGYACWMHGTEAWENMTPAVGRALRRARLVLVNSRYTLDRYTALHGDLPTAHVCWLGTGEDVAPPLAAGTRPPVVLILSRLDAGDLYKGHRELIDCWPRVVAAVPAARLAIAGGGSGLTEISSVVKASPAAHAIDVLGFIPEADITRLWQRAAVFAMPSRGEGFGIVYVEAMRQGLSVIASVHDAGSEVNVDGETGFNISLDRRDELADRIIYLLLQPDLARQLGAAGQRRWREHFCVSAFRRRFARLFLEYAGQPLPSPRQATSLGQRLPEDEVQGPT